MIPVGDWAKDRLSNLSENDLVRDESKVNSGFGKKVSNWIGRNQVYPTNVLYLATECSNKNHSAVFPLDLPKWFIKLFTESGDVVLDPFVGSGTTCLAAMELGRNYVGIDIMEDYVELSRQRLYGTQMRIPTIAEKNGNNDYST
jgi:DNA modification methylase